MGWLCVVCAVALCVIVYAGFRGLAEVEAMEDRQFQAWIDAQRGESVQVAL